MQLTIYMAHDRKNGKCYFGSTFQSLEKRKKQHEYYAKKRVYGHFYKALAKRPDDFFWLEVSKHNTNGHSREEEEQIISRYWGQPWLYNMKPQATGFARGSLNPNQTFKWKALMKQKLSGENNPMFGRGLQGSKNPMFGTKAWNNPNGKRNRRVWEKAEELYTNWVNNGEPGVRKLARTFGAFSYSNLTGIHKKFRNGWVPAADIEYLYWKHSKV